MNENKLARRKLIGVLTAFVLLSGCINPFDGGRGSGTGGVTSGTAQGEGSVTVSLDQGLSGSTVAPDGNALATNTSHYSITLVDPTSTFPPVNPTNLSPGAFPYTVANLQAINWDVTLYAHDGSGNIIGQSQTTPVLVTTGTTNVPLTVAAVRTGANGTVQYDLTWPAAEVDTATVNLFTVANPTDPLDGSGTSVPLTSGVDYTLDLGAGTLSINRTLPSALYYLEIQLTFAGGAYPPVYEAVQVYDYLTSSKSVAISAAELTDPPAAPSGLQATLSGDGSLDLTWNDNSSMESGFRVFRNSTLLATVGPGVTTHTASGLSGTAENFEVRAYNDFGESTGAVGTFTAVLDPGAGALTLGTSGNATSAWADPQLTMDWSAFTGSESYTLYFSTTQADVDNFLAGAVVSTNAVTGNQPSSFGQTLTTGTTYYWNVAASNSSTNGSYAYPTTQSFTVRDSLYVSSPSNGNAGSPVDPGSPTAPVDTVGGALGMLLPGENIPIRVAGGVYPESVTINRNITIEGGFSPAGFGAPDPTAHTTQIGEPGVGLAGISVSGSIGTTVLISGGSIVDLTGLTIAGTDDGGFSNRRAIAITSATTVYLTNTTIRSGLGDPFEAVGIQIGNNSANLTMATSGIHTSNIRGFEASDAASDSHAYAILIPVTYQGTIDITNTTFDTFQNALDRSALMMYNSGGTGSIRVTNSDINLGNGGRPKGLRLMVDGTVEVLNNAITSSASVAGGQTYGVELVGLGQRTIENNYVDFSGPQASFVGIGVYGDGLNNVVGADIFNNVVAGSATGANSSVLLYLETVDGPRVLHNTLVQRTDADDNVHIDTQDNQAVVIANNLLYDVEAVSGLSRGIRFLGNIINAVNANLFHQIPQVTSGQTHDYASADELNRQFSAASGNFGMDPVLDASFRPTAGTTPYRARSGGDDYTLVVGVDRLGASRTSGNGTTVGAYELDDPRTLGRIVLAGTDGGLDGLVVSDIRDDGNQVALANQTEVVNAPADAELDYGSLADVRFDPNDPNRIFWISGGGNLPFLYSRTISPLGALTTEMDIATVSGVGILIPTGFIVHETGINLQFLVTDVNGGLYSLIPATANYGDFGFVPAPQRGGIATDGNRMWHGILGDPAFIQRTDTTNPAATGPTQLNIEQLPAEASIYPWPTSIFYDASTSQVYYAVASASNDGYIAVDDAEGGATGDQTIIIPAGQTSNTPETVSVDSGREILYWSEGSTLNMSFTDGWNSRTLHSVSGGGGKFDIVPQ